jgi:DNA-binding CsgD family transcriptional regulator
MGRILCPVLIGRSTQLQALTGALNAAGQGRGSALVITGEPGVGKTRLLREVVAVAQSRGFLVLTGRASESAVPVPFRPVTEALMGAARAGIVPDSPALADYRAALGTLIPEWSLPGDVDAELSPLILGEALLRVLSLPGWPGGLLVLEDLHWADPETLSIIEYLADNLAATSICCLITIRVTEPTAALELLESLGTRRAATIVEVPRLTRDEVAEMAVACLEVPETPAAVASMLARCDGLPFAVEEILAAAVTAGELVRGDDGWHVDKNITTGVPPSIVGSIRNRLTALGGHARDVIVSAAVLGKRFDWTLLPGVAGVSEPEALRVLQEAHRLQLIEPVRKNPGSFRFRHSLTRAAILSDLLPPELAFRSARAAEEVEAAHSGLPGVWCELAAELHATAGQPLDSARLFLLAGRRALAQGAITSATSALRAAGRLLSEPSGAAATELQTDVDEALVQALALRGDYGQLSLLLADLLGRLDVSGADRRRAAFILLRAAERRPQDYQDMTAGYIDQARTLARGLGDPELDSRIDVTSARSAFVSGGLDQAEQLARRSLTAAEAAGLTGWAAEVAVESLIVIGHRHRIDDLGASRAAYQQAHAIACEHGLGVARIRTLHDLATVDMFEDGQTDGLTEVSELAHAAGLASIATIIDMQLANIWSLGTELDQALEAAMQFEHGARQIGAPLIEAFAIVQQAAVHAIRGDAAESSAAAGRAEAMMPGDPSIRMGALVMARMVVELFRDNIARAAQLSADAGTYRQEILRTPARARGFYSSAQFPVAARGWGWGLHALLQAATGGDIQPALDLAHEAQANVSFNRGWLAYAEAVLAGQQGRPREAAALAAEGADCFASFAPWWNHVARRLVATAALRDQWGQPNEWMREASAGFDAAGYPQLASACRGILRQAGQRVPRAGRGTARVPMQMRRLGVTSREMDVYLLVARGHSNAEIAEKLFISRKTVETHIASLVAKTNQASRRELVAHAARSIHP